MTSKINYGETLEFQKDFKRLLKKFKSLEDDLELAKIAAIEIFHIQKIPIHSRYGKKIIGRYSK